MTGVSSVPCLHELPQSTTDLYPVCLLLVCSVCSEAVVNLTKRTVESAAWHGREGTADYRWDDDLPAFGIRVYPSGRKSFIVSYRAQGASTSTRSGSSAP